MKWLAGKRAWRRGNSCDDRTERRSRPR